MATPRENASHPSASGPPAPIHFIGTQPGRRAERKKNLPKKTSDPLEQFPKGTMVRLISGGPNMTVNDYHDFDGSVTCVWFSGKKLERGNFARETLVLVTDDTEEKS
jgi:uncharacterized protein YodC (DUF2158 family)